MSAADAPKRELATILVVDDDKNILQVLEARLSFAHYKTIAVSSAEAAVATLARQPVDLIVSDVKMPGMGGAGLLHEVLGQWPHIPVILLTAYGSIPDAVSSIRDGAADYLTKPFDGHQLLEKIAALLGRTKAAATPSRKGGKAVSDVIWGGKSPAMREFYSLLERVAPTDVAVLVLGESGTGKEMVARMLHDLSPRAKGPFVIVDCGSTQPTLLESELFGHVKGAFTHAVRDKKGLMEEADGGTLFLDEIGNISPEMQTRLLRFLQERTIRRVGDTRAIPVNCRVIAATNADLPALVKKGDFREDLYFRLKVVTLHVPPLRERKEDIPLLTERFLETICAEQHRSHITAAPETLKMLLEHSWPGNVRELKHALEGGVVFCNGNRLEPRDIQLDNVEDLLADAQPPRRDEDSRPEPPHSDSRHGTADADLSLEENEHQAIIRALERTAWVKKNAADLLGISRRAIHYKIKKYNIQVPGKNRDD